MGLWEKDPIVERNIASLLYKQSVFIYRDEARERKRNSKIVAGFHADQLSDMLRQDPREDPLEKEADLNRVETAVAKATSDTKRDLEKAFLEVLLTEADVIDAASRWHVKIGQVVNALALRGFNVTRRDVDNLRERFKRNPDFRAVASYMRGEQTQPAQRNAARR